MNIDELRDAVAGPVHTAGQPGFRDEVAGFQLAARPLPAVVVGATSAADVAAAVGYASTAGLPLGVQATGHGAAAAAEDGVLINTARMDGVRIDPGARTAWIEAGVRWGAVVAAAAEHGLAPPSGSFPGVGAVSYLLSGGISVLARHVGYAADAVLRAEVVTADGVLRTVDGTAEPELFWALRGAGHNFGVVTGLEVRLLPLRTLFGGGLHFDLAETPQILDVWRRWSAGLPDELSTSIVLIPFPDLPALPEHLRGRHVAHLRIAYAGDAETGARLIAPLREAGPRLAEETAEIPYTATETIFQEPDDPHAYHGTNVLLRELDERGLDVVRALASSTADDMPCIVGMVRLGGALSRSPAGGNAVGHRQARYLLSVLSPLGEAGGAQVHAAHERRLAALEEDVVLGRRLNYLFGEHSADQVEAAWEPADFARLRELKAKYDPANLFRANHNIPPG